MTCTGHPDKKSTSQMKYFLATFIIEESLEVDHVCACPWWQKRAWWLQSKDLCLHERWMFGFWTHRSCLLWKRFCGRCWTRIGGGKLYRGGCCTADVFVYDGQNPRKEQEFDVGCTGVSSYDAVFSEACCTLLVELFQRTDSTWDRSAHDSSEVGWGGGSDCVGYTWTSCRMSSTVR